MNNIKLNKYTFKTEKKISNFILPSSQVRVSKIAYIANFILRLIFRVPTFYSAAVKDRRLSAQSRDLHSDCSVTARQLQFRRNQNGAFRMQPKSCSDSSITLPTASRVDYQQTAFQLLYVCYTIEKQFLGIRPKIMSSP